MGQLLCRPQIQLKQRRVFLRRRLAEGGFSYVDLVVDRDTAQLYAMKRMVCHGRRELDMAQQEIADYLRFDHPNIVKVIDQGTVSSRQHRGATEVLCLFPLYTNGTLQDKIDKLRQTNGSFDENEMLRIFKGICHGVKAMHEAKPVSCCHRDLKPGNVLLSAENVPVLTDFGSVQPGLIQISSRKEAMAEQDRAAEHSTLPFRAPELVEVTTERNITTKCDIWSLGCVLYAMAYHDTPFERISAQGGSVALAIAQGVVEFPAHDRYTKELKDLILMMLTVDPDRRPDIDAVIAAVNRLCPDL